MKPPAPAAALDAAYSGLTAVVRDLADADLLLPTACRGWTVADLLLHVTLDAQRALVALHTPADGPPDVDSVTYWRSFPGSGNAEAAAAHAQWVRRAAAAYERPSGVVGRWTETAPAAVHAARTADPAGFVSTQDHVLAVPDFVATLVTEAVIHHLDLIASLPGAAGPPQDAVAVTLSTMEGLAGPGGLPAEWAPAEALRKSSGRDELTAADRQALGARADQFPLIA
ncbi:maleylpyruvate isomerase N-terminal domain-containing protein [Actinoplanes sp. NPDC049681]|uniref:maleylpyruvate isomerase N-terminal domain-containing protein n=1 Tax=Actinoplanes sp. NPDC049681 TaxID=3363905 RepID=UPI0037A92EFB